MNVTDYLLENGQSNQPAIISTNITVTYDDLRRAVGTLTAHLHSLGAENGDRIGILAGNSFFWTASYLAIMSLGCVAVPFAPIILPKDLQEKIKFVNCKILCVQKKHYRKFSEVLQDKIKLVFDDQLVLLADNKGPILVQVDPDQDAALMFTSGTTNVTQRAVRITHKNILANTDSIISGLKLSSDERILAALQFYYCFGTSLLHTHLRTGGTLILVDNFIYPEIVLDLMQQTEATGFAGVPSTFQTLLRNTTFRKRTFPNLFKIQQAGGKLHEVLLRELIETLPQSEIFVMYGQTEATARLSILPHEKLETKFGSVGKGIPGVELSVVDEFNQSVGLHQIGEIIARGDNISPGYLNDPKGTAEKFPGGVLHTGDLAMVDQDGYITIVDRKSDFIKSNGYRISSQEVEAHALTLSDIVSAAAVGEADLVHGEAIRLFVTLRKGSLVTPDDILQHCRQVMPRYMIPEQVIILKRMPVNAHGKIVKSELKNYLIQQ